MGQALDRRVALMVAAGCAISLLSFGTRSVFGIFTEPLSAAHGWTRDVFALAIALQNLMWGVAQPVAGAIADRWGPWRVVVGGGALFALGMLLMPAADSPLALHLTAGLLVGAGMGGASYIIVLGALGRGVPESRRGWALGLGTAAGSLGQFLVVPLGQLFVSLYGWQVALVLLAALVATMPALALGLRGIGAKEDLSGPSESLGQAVRRAVAHPSYLMLTAGFFVCGFQLAFITVHLPPFLTDHGISPATAAMAVAAIGLANVVGAYLSGVWSGRASRKMMLSLIYVGRGLAIAFFVTLPVTPATTVAFTVTMGLLWLSTVPPTSGLVALMFGPRYMATLFGLAFLSHQVGSFLGVWLGGLLFEATHSYTMVWWLAAALSMAAAVINLPIAERTALPVPQPQPAPAE